MSICVPWSVTSVLPSASAIEVLKRVDASALIALGSTLIPVPEPEPAPLYIIRDRDAGTVVDLSRQPAFVASPRTHAADLLLEFLMNDDAPVGQVATEKVVRTCYLAACRHKGIRPFRWLAVLRQFNQIYGAANQKTYRNVYEGGRLRKRPVYRVPTAEEVARALADPDVAVVPPRKRA